MSLVGDWSESLNSTYTKDETLAFESPILAEAHKVWAQSGSIPARSDFTPRTAKNFLGNLQIFERVEATYRIRLMGSRISAVLGEMQGKLLEEALPPEVVTRWRTVLDEVLAMQKPLRVVKTVDFHDLHYLEAELFMAPLLDSEGEPTMVFAVAVFRSGVASSRKLDDLIASNK